jgi:signal transduction histidine kinase
VTQLIETQRLVELRTLELQKLSGQLMQVQDDERRRLSRTLHDELGQELAALKITISGASVEDEENLSPALEMIDRAISKVRNISYLLHPPLLDESGLVPALHWYFEGLRRRGHLRITFTPTPIDFPRLPGDIETAIFRVVQESLTNVYRHSGSEDARIDIDQQDDRVTVRVRDFGKGMGSAVPLMGVGVSGMKERIRQLNGELKISNEEPGTLVLASVPLFDAGPTRVWSSN